MLVLALLVLLGWLISHIIERARCKREGLPYISEWALMRSVKHMLRNIEKKEQSETQHYHIDIRIRKK